LANPEQVARQEIDRLLVAAGWVVQDIASANLHATRGVALREFPLNPGHGHADYLLYVDGRECPNFCVRGGMLNSSLRDVR